jgi:type II secretory pathway pseudopilin PulG
MKINRSRQLKADGFTFMELVVAITLVSLIFALLFTGFNLAIQSLRRGETKIVESEQARGVFELFRRQIASIYPVVPEEEEEDAEGEGADSDQPAPRRAAATQQLPYFLGSPQKVAFISLFSLRINSIPGLCFVAYVIEPSEDGDGFNLVEYEKQYTGINPMSDLAGEQIPGTIFRYVLLKNLVASSFEYYGYDFSQLEGGADIELEKQWFDIWDVEINGDLPEAVRINFMFKPEGRPLMSEGQILVPIHSHGNILRRPGIRRALRASR